jgi:hypothetical protein
MKERAFYRRSELWVALTAILGTVIPAYDGSSSRLVAAFAAVIIAAFYFAFRTSAPSRKPGHLTLPFYFSIALVAATSTFADSPRSDPDTIKIYFGEGALSAAAAIVGAVTSAAYSALRYMIKTRDDAEDA